jgi:hypothetical protein
MDLLTDDVTHVQPVLEEMRPMIEAQIGPVGFTLFEGHYVAVDFHGQVFKVWVNVPAKRMELEQL